MNDSQILNAALALPSDARIAIAESLYDSLERTDKKNEAAWISEAESRIDAYQRGEVDTVSAQEVFGEYLG